MIIGLLSDTHMLDTVLTLPTEVKDAFRDVELILHAGDIFAVSVLDELESLAPVLAAEGDGEYSQTRTDRRVKERQVIAVDGVTIWLWHDGDEQWSQDKYEKPPDVIVSGHTHWPTVENSDGILWVNPGSPTLPNYEYELGTVGLMTVSSGKAEAQIIRLK
jgi:putative phosphoesterase